MTNFKTIKFTDGDLSLDVRVSVEDNTIWLSINEMALLFGYERSTISRRVRTTYNDLLADGCSECVKKELSLCKSGKKVIVPIYHQNIIKTVGEKLRNDIFDKVLSFVNQNNNALVSDSNIIIYNNGSINLNVNIDHKEDTVWLSQEQIATLFNTTQQNVSLHIKNIFNEGELDVDSVYKDFLYTAQDNKQYYVGYYNLDLILAIGYRIKGATAIAFRKWASKILKDYLINGAAISNKNDDSIFYKGLLNLNNEYLCLKNEIDLLKTNLLNSNVKGRIFFKGEYFDSYAFVVDLLSKAKSSVTIIDPYFEYTGLEYLKKLSPEIQKKIIKSQTTKLRKTDLAKFEMQYGKISVTTINNFHDRFIVIDNELCYALGTSLNSMGRKLFAIYQIETKEIIDSILKFVG